MSGLKNVMIVVLAVALTALTGVAWRQQAEIARLRGPSAWQVVAPVSLVGVRNGTEHRVSFPPVRSATIPGDDRFGDQYRLEFGLGNQSRRDASSRRASQTLARLAGDPEFLSALGVYQLGALDARFAGLFRKLNLEAEELTMFKRLLAEKEGAEFDVVAVGQRVAESPLSPEDLRETIRTVKARVEGEIENSLGAQRYEIYRDYERTLPQRATVAQLEQRLSYSKTPLATEQAEALVHILAEHAPAKDGVVAAPAAFVASGDEALQSIRAGSGAAVVSDEALGRAQGMLSPGQYSALQQIQSEQLSALRASQLIRGATPDANTRLLDWRILLQ